MDPVLRQPLPTNGSLGLPDEVLTTVFQNVLPANYIGSTGWGEADIKFYYQRLSVLRKVCVVWMEVIDSSPNLWALIDSTALNVEECLIKSKSVPLTIRLHRKQLGDDKELVNWKRILGEMSRWDIVKFNGYMGGDREGYASGLEASPAPILRGLTLTNYSDGAPIIIDLFRSTAPRLRQLSLRQISLKHWDSPFLYNLRELSLDKVTGPTIEQLLAILEASSYLTKLSIYSVHVDDDTSASKPIRTVNLPSLDWLTISYLSPVTTNDRLLRTIQAPSCRDFSSWVTGAPTPQGMTLYAGFMNISFRSFLTTAEDVWAKVFTESSDQVYIQATERNHDTFDIDLRGFSPHSFWSTFVPLLFPETSPVQIKLDFHRGGSDVLLETSAWTLCGVCKIILGWDGERVIEQLTFAKMIDGESRWLWPRLRDLVVSSVSGEKLLRMLEARAGAAVTKLRSDDQRYTPVPIGRLILRPSCKVSSKTLEDIGKFVGVVETHSWHT
ncbi:hypothetical protein FRB93_014010 [Tulasnella sp. JGI-2019a]|nr:hypothetical protein FRB93_014010 [Tulasnella sp. JGI-2019a]